MTRSQKRQLFLAFLLGLFVSILANQVVRAQLPPIVELKGNESSEARIDLGLSLFFDTGMSRPPGISCASCHSPTRAFSAELAIGVNGQIGRRDPPSVLNACFKRRMFGDGRVAFLEGQAAFPLLSSGEMNGTVESITAYLKSEPLYVEMFESAYGEEPSFMGAVKAIACFERELVSFDAPIDRYLDGETWALNEKQKLGLAVFLNCSENTGFSDKKKIELTSSTKGPEKFLRGEQGSCTSCHNGLAGFNVDFDGELRPHNIGSREYSVDPGVAIITSDLVGQAVTPDDGKFVTQSLREHQLTAPYGWRGQWKTTEDVIAFKERGGDPTRNLSSMVRSYKWTPKERSELAYFLKTAFAGDFKQRIGELGIKVKQ